MHFYFQVNELACGNVTAKMSKFDRNNDNCRMSDFLSGFLDPWAKKWPLAMKKNWEKILKTLQINFKRRKNNP